MFWPGSVSIPTPQLQLRLTITGGWPRELKDGKIEFYRDINKQIDQAFENCQVALESAGGKGWSQVSPTSGLRGETAE